MTQQTSSIGFIGFGEAGQAFTSGLRQDNVDLAITAFDIKTSGPHADAKRADYIRFDVDEMHNASQACAGSDLIFSLVTADQAESAAKSAAQNDLKNAFYFDCNSCASNTKRKAAAVIEAAGGRYLDVAVMTPVYPKLHKAPCLLAGPHAEVAQEVLSSLGMNSSIAGTNVGDASTRKMIRSVMVKGLEALTIECFLAARKAGIEDDILASLDKSYSGFDWPARAPYMLERAITHGSRRASEMHEVAKTLRDLGVAPYITEGTIARQSQAGALGLDAAAIGPDNLGSLTSAMLKAIAATDGSTSKGETDGDE